MGLSCSCPYDDGDFEWYFSYPDDYSIMPVRKRRVRCCSCHSLIGHGAIVAEFERSRYANNDIEERIYGDGHDAVPLASMFLCEECADLWWSFRELGFECINPDENQHELLKEYHELVASQRETSHD